MTAHADPFADLGPEVGRDEWDEPVPLRAIAVPRFPLGVLPPWMESFASDVACALQVPRELPALLELAAASAAVAGKWQIEVKPEYSEPLNLWVVVPLESGNRKSRCVRVVSAPISDWEHERALDMRDEIAEAESRARIKASALQKAERSAGAAEGAERLRLEADALTLAREAAAMDVPRAPRLLADDVTAERLATLLMECGGRMAILSPEGDVFDLMGGRYSNNIPNIGVYLRAHTGDRIIVDRTGRAQDYVESPALVMGISPQPEVLRGLTQKPGFRGRGLLARFLYSLPESLVGRRDSAAQALCAQARNAYGERLRRLLDLPAPEEPHVLRLDARASAAWLRFERQLEPRLGERGDLGPLADWGCKLAGQAARIAGVLHLAACVEHATPRSPADLPAVVREQTMTAALRLATYFVAHARAAFAQMGADLTSDGAAHILDWICAQEKTEFSKRECWRAMRGHLERAEDLDAPLARLCTHGYIRPLGQDPSAGEGKRPRGRPAGPRFEVNPAAHVAPRTEENEDIGHFGHYVQDVSAQKNGHGPAEKAPAGEWIPL
jgi:replicative DNA helicase